jgi:AcrR family transcriptional regulator
MPRVVPQYREEAKERIVKGALEIFATKGYHETTMDDVAKEIGISKGALYLYFASKEVLFTEICKVGQVQFQNVLHESFSDRDLLAGADRFFDRMMEENDVYSKGLLFETLAEASRNKEIRALLEVSYEQAIQTLAEFLTQLNSKRIFRSDVDLRLLARGLIALYDGFIANLMTTSDRTEVKKAWNTIMKSVILGTLAKR